MNEIIAAVCENSKTDCDILTGYLKKAGRELHQTIQMHTFSSERMFCENLSSKFDIVFLDVHFPEGGIDRIVRRLRNYNHHVYLVFMSSSADSFSMGYEYGARNYLLKPLNYLQILKEMKRYLEQEALLSEPFLWLSSKKGLFKIYYAKLRFIETEARHLLFHYGTLTLSYTGKISDYIDTLPESVFFRCNNSYIVNLKYIISIVPDGNRYNIHLITGEIIPLSRSRYRDCLLLLRELQNNTCI